MSDEEIVNIRLTKEQIAKLDECVEAGAFESRTEAILTAMEVYLFDEPDWHARIDTLGTMAVDLTEEQAAVLEAEIGQLHRLADAAEDAEKIPVTDGGSGPAMAYWKAQAEVVLDILDFDVELIERPAKDRLVLKPVTNSREIRREIVHGLERVGISVSSTVDASTIVVDITQDQLEHDLAEPKEVA